jgi:GNAT superfamily N-acetyltransferase
VLLGPVFVRAFYRWQAETARAQLTVALLDGEVVGFVGLHEGAYTVPMLRGCWRALVGSLARRPHLLFSRRLWSRFAREPTSDWAAEFRAATGTAQVTCVAVAASSRGHGIFSAMIRHAEESSRGRGMLAAMAAVYRDNSASRRAFTKCGWQECEALGSAATVCFVRVLNPSMRQRFPRLPSAEREQAG